MLRRNACPPTAARRWMPPAKGPRTVYVVSRMPPERERRRKWDAADYLFGRRNCANGSNGGMYFDIAGARQMRLSERVPWGRAGRGALRRLHCFYSASFESHTRQFVRGLNSNASLLHRG